MRIFNALSQLFSTALWQVTRLNYLFSFATDQDPSNPQIMTETTSADSVNEISLIFVDENNQTWEGAIHLDNSSLVELFLDEKYHSNATKNYSKEVSENKYNPMGAGAFTIVVLSVYGLAICLMVMYYVFANKHEQDWASQENEKELYKYLEQAANSSFKRHNDKEKLRKFKYNIINTMFEGKALTPERLNEINEVSDLEENPTTPLMAEHGTAIPHRSFLGVGLDENNNDGEIDDDELEEVFLNSEPNYNDLDLSCEADLEREENEYSTVSCQLTENCFANHEIINENHRCGDL